MQGNGVCKEQVLTRVANLVNCFIQLPAGWEGVPEGTKLKAWAGANLGRAL